MGNSEDGKSVKPEKPSSPAPPPDQAVHVYPDWAAMQAYYGQRVAVPQYFNSAVAPGQAPHPYMWGPPQPMMPPYGAPYAAIYAHGGVYAHPAVPLAASPLSVDAPAKSSGNTDRGLMKKLKGFDGLAMSIGNGNADSNEGGTDAGLSQSGETEGSSGGSDGNSEGARPNGLNRSREGTPNLTGEGKVETQSNLFPSVKANTSGKMMAIAVGPARVAGKVEGNVLSPSVTSSLELKDSPAANGKTSSTSAQPSSNMIPSESWIHNERELKRERRKQSNRESARRSRLRKQAEAEELAIKVNSLTAENVTLKSELNRLTDNSEKLKKENAKLMEKMKNAIVQTEDAKNALTANLLSRVNNGGSVDIDEGEGEMYEKKSNAGAKLHQLLDSSPRTDAVAAS